jgi:pimeloyl-ACP methyl ester carboxylesterase
VTTFVLVHGAFRGGWAWRSVRERLVAAGHDVRTPSLTGCGDRAHLAGPGRGGVTLSTWVTDLVSLCDSFDLRDVVLVGHSQGGLVTTAATDALADRLSLVVHLDAPVPRDGERGVDLNPPGVTPPSADDVDLDAWFPPTPLVAGPDLDADLVAWVNARLGPTPVRPSFEPVTVGAAARAVPVEHVFFTRTPETYPCWVTRRRLDAEGGCYRLLDAGHDAPLTAPDAVAEVLLDLAGRS